MMLREGIFRAESWTLLKILAVAGGPRTFEGFIKTSKWNSFSSSNYANSSNLFVVRAMFEFFRFSNNRFPFEFHSPVFLSMAIDIEYRHFLLAWKRTLDKSANRLETSAQINYSILHLSNNAQQPVTLCHHQTSYHFSLKTFFQSAALLLSG